MCSSDLRPARVSYRLVWSVVAITGLAICLFVGAVHRDRGSRAFAAAPVPTRSTRVQVRAAKPIRPRSYRVPGVRSLVSSSGQLRRALAHLSRKTIVLADGTYRAAQAFVNARGDRIYAQHLGRAKLTAGLVIGAAHGPVGAVVRGVVFDVADSGATEDGAAIDVWGSATSTRILDVTIDGHKRIGSGILARQTRGLRVQRVIARRFTSYGVYADAYPDYGPLPRPMVLTDIDATQVSRPVPRSANGTAEACLWVGSRAIVQRVHVADCAWMGVWTGTGTSKSLLEDLDVDRTHVGIYAEHYTQQTTFRRFRVGPAVVTGVVCEWDNPKTGGKPVCVQDTFADGMVDSTRNGVYLDEGTSRTTVTGVTFRNQTRAGIVNYRGDQNVFTRNDFTQLAPGAIPITDDPKS